MTENNNEEVKEFVERVEIAGSTDDDENDTENGESSEPKESEEETELEDKTEDEGTETEEVVKPTPKGKGDEEVKEIQGETPRERALRLELTRTRSKLRQERIGEIIGQPKVDIKQREITPEQKNVLSKYDPKQLESLREVFPALAEELGFVREEQLHVKEVVTKSNEIFEKFMEEHPEYSEENDPEGTLWNALKEEYNLFGKPNDPKQLQKILERAHREVMGIKPEGALKTTKAAQEKIKVASHGSTSKPQTQARREEQLVGKTQGLRKDMLKGFSEQDLADMGLD